MKPLSACTSIVGIADTGLRMVVRELLITLKLRDIEYVSDTDTLLQTFQRKPGVDLIILQHDLPPGGGSLDVAKSVRWGKMSPNRNVPIVTIGRDWTPQKLVDVREAGINEVIAMPTAMQTVQRKLTSALNPEWQFISVDDYRGPSRRRRTTGHQGPFRRAADRIAEQLHNAEDKSARRTETLEKLAAARPPEERPASTAISSPPPSRRPEAALEIPAEDKFLAQARLNDFDGKSKGARPPPTQPALSPRTEDLGEGRAPSATSAETKPSAPPLEHDFSSAPGISTADEKSDVSPPPIPSAQHGGEGMPQLKESPSAASGGSEPPPPDGTTPSPRPVPPASGPVGDESKQQQETKAPPRDTEPTALQHPKAPAGPPVVPASEAPTWPQRAEPSPTPPLRSSPDNNLTEHERPASSTGTQEDSPVDQAFTPDTSHEDGAPSLGPAADQSEVDGKGIGQSANPAQGKPSSGTQLPVGASSPALPSTVAQLPDLPPIVASSAGTQAAASEQDNPAAPSQSVAEPPAHQTSGPSAIEELPGAPASAGSPPSSEKAPTVSPLANNSSPPPTTIGGQAADGGSSVAGGNPIDEERPTAPMSQADLFKMLTVKKKKT
jgi:DNA-binding response OmpR family regulator